MPVSSNDVSSTAQRCVGGLGVGGGLSPFHDDVETLHRGAVYVKATVVAAAARGLQLR